MNHQRKSLSQYGIPLAIVAALVLVFLLAYRDRLLPATDVDVMVAVAIPTEADRAESPTGSADRKVREMIFQATGWIEPDPLPIRATTLYSGVVKDVMVLEGETVREGQLLATLVDDDARLALRDAEAGLARQEAAARHVSAQIDVARARQATLEEKLRSEQARLDEAEDQSRRLRLLSEGAVPEVELTRARLRLQGQTALAAAAAGEVAEAGARVVELNRHLDLQRQFVAAAEVEVDRARLHLDRTRITAPSDGVVLRLLAAPGLRRMLEMDHPDSATVAVLYHPDHLQARVDVPLADAGQVAVGQPVKVHCSLLPDTAFEGVVTRIVGEADWQRNTLQVKVRLENPDPRLRPEMLCRAEFFAGPNRSENRTAATDSPAGTESFGSGTWRKLTVMVPESILRDRDGNRAAIWAVSIDGAHAEKRAVQLGKARMDDRVSVVDGVRPGDRLIVNAPESMEPGDRVRPRLRVD